MNVLELERYTAEHLAAWAIDREEQLRAEIERAGRVFAFSQAVWRDTMLTVAECRALGRGVAA